MFLYQFGQSRSYYVVDDYEYIIEDLFGVTSEAQDIRFSCDIAKISPFTPQKSRRIA